MRRPPGGRHEEKDMKTIFLGGATAALALIAATVAAQPAGSSAGAGASPDSAATSTAAGMDSTAQTPLAPGSDMKRATRKSRRDATGTAGAGMGGEATVRSDAGNRTPDGK
jgi:hypothetical protein